MADACGCGQTKEGGVSAPPRPLLGKSKKKICLIFRERLLWEAADFENRRESLRLNGNGTWTEKILDEAKKVSGKNGGKNGKSQSRSWGAPLGNRVFCYL